MPWDVDGYVASLTAASPHTREAYARDARQFVDWAERGGCDDPEDLDHPTLRRYLAFLGTQRLAKRTIARKAASLRSFLRYLKRRGVVTTDSGRSLRAPKGPARLPRVPNVAEAGALLDRVATAERSDDPVARALALQDIAVLEILYGTGLRVSECCGLTPRDCDLDGGSLTVLGKGSKVRRVPARRTGAGRPAATGSGRADRWSPGPTARPMPSSSTSGAGACPHGTPGASWTAFRCPMGTPCTHTSSGTPTLRTCSKAEPTCGPCRSCSATPTWLPPRSTPISPATASGRSTRQPIPVPDDTSTVSAQADAAEVVAELWRDYKEGGTADARERLILHYSPLVKFVAGRVAAGLPQNIEQADLVSYGIFGLIDAIDKFDPGRGFKFETYAISRIKGAIIDELRSIDWVPRSVRVEGPFDRARRTRSSRTSCCRTPEESRGRGGARRDRGRARADAVADQLRRSRRARRAARARVDRGGGTTVGDTIADRGQRSRSRRSRSTR